MAGSDAMGEPGEMASAGGEEYDLGTYVGMLKLYLTNEADYAPDHVHDDAELIEHFLTEAEVAELDRQLDFPSLDPHGKPIPGGAMP